MPARFSVIIPLYNKADFILRTLWSLVNQQLKFHEIIIVDDVSTDNSRQVVGSFIQQHPTLPIKCIVNPVNMGPGACRNRGIEVSTGSHLLFIDADDTYEPTLLSKLNQVVGEGKAELVIFAYHRVPSRNIKRGFTQQPPWLRHQKDEFYHLQPVMDCTLSRRFPLLVSNAMLSRSAIENLRFDESRANFEGIDFWFRALQHCAEHKLTVGYLDQPLHVINTLEDSLIRQPLHLRDVKVPKAILRFAKSHDYHEKQFNQRLATTWFWHDFSRLFSKHEKLVFIWRYRWVLPLLSYRYRTP